MKFDPPCNSDNQGSLSRTELGRPSTIEQVREIIANAPRVRVPALVQRHSRLLRACNAGVHAYGRSRRPRGKHGLIQRGSEVGRAGGDVERGRRGPSQPRIASLREHEEAGPRRSPLLLMRCSGLVTAERSCGPEDHRPPAGHQRQAPTAMHHPCSGARHQLQPKPPLRSRRHRRRHQP